MISHTSSHNTMSSLRVVLISTTILSAAIMLRFSAPAISDLAVNAPSIYNGVVSWLRPPYLYLVINCIIITIVASSKLQSPKDDDVALPPPILQPQPATAAVEVKSIILTDYPVYNGVVSNESIGFREADVNNETTSFAASGEEDAMSNKENEFVVVKSTWTDGESKVMTEYSPSSVKPPVSARFGHRRSLKASPEGGRAVLGVSKSKRQDTLESTWKTITEGRAIPITRHLRKSDTWERDNHHGRHQPQKTPEKMMAKAETFTDRTNTRSPSPGSSGGSGKLKREASLGQDELNRRVEAFIKKFNEEMRLQRQESLNQYMDMINRGSH